jgi:hypothetical protein
VLPNPKHPSTTEKNPSLGIGKRIFSWVLQDVSRFGPRDGGWAEFYIIPAEASSHSYCAGNNTNGAKYISRTCKPCLFNKLCLSIIKHLQGLGHISVDPNLIISRPLLGPTATCIWDPLFNSYESKMVSVLVPNCLCLGLTRWSIKLQHIEIKTHRPIGSFHSESPWNPHVGKSPRYYPIISPITANDIPWYFAELCSLKIPVFHYYTPIIVKSIVALLLFLNVQSK